MPTPFVFLTAPPGTGLRAASETLSRYLIEARFAGRVESVQFVDVEDQLPKPFKTFIESHPKSQVVKAWRHALTQSLSALREDAALCVVSAHLTLYNYVRSEFYTPVDATLLLGSGLTHIVLLIDDVFDMYSKLSGAGEVYDAARRLEHHEDSAWEQLKRHGIPVFSDRDRALLRLEAGASDVTALLAWRRAEMIQADALASALGVDLTLLGVKHPVEVGALSIVQPQTIERVYLSHPISRPRGHEEVGGSWPPVVRQFNSVALELAKSEILAVMPTAIDEYRLSRPSIEDERREAPADVLDLYNRELSLMSRWPNPDTEASLISGASGELGQDRLSWALGPTEESPELASPDVRRQVGGQLRSLENVIEQEVPFRDHFLVHHLPHLLVFRPLYGSWEFDLATETFPDGGGTFSGGVRREIEHWSEASSDFPGIRRVAFVHASEDIARLDRVLRGRVQAAATRSRIVSLAADVLVRKGYYGPADAQIVVGEGRIRSELLAKRRFSDAEMLRHRSEGHVRAGVRYLLSQVTLVEDYDESVAIFVVSDASTLPAWLFRHLVTFFRTGTRADPVSEIEQALGVSIPDWVSALLDAT